MSTQTDGRHDDNDKLNDFSVRAPLFSTAGHAKATAGVTKPATDNMHTSEKRTVMHTVLFFSGHDKIEHCILGQK